MEGRSNFERTHCCIGETGPLTSYASVTVFLKSQIPWSLRKKPQEFDGHSGFVIGEMKTNNSSRGILVSLSGKIFVLCETFNFPSVGCFVSSDEL